MRSTILLHCIWLASAGIFPEKRHDLVTFNGKHYNKELLLTNIQGARGMSLDESTNTLFFSRLYPENTAFWRGIAYYNIDTKEFKDLREIKDGFTTSVDSETGDVYLGGSDGIYKFNSLNKTAVPYAAKGVDIFFIYVYKRLLYYTTCPDNEIYSYDGTETRKVSNVQIKTFIGDEKKFFFINNTGLYRVLNNQEENAEIFSDSQYNYYSFAKDNNNNIYVNGWDGVFVLNEENKGLDNIASIKIINDLVFDENNNIIYSDQNSIYRLTPSEAYNPID